MVGDSPLLVYELFFTSAFGSVDGIGYTLFYATPLIFTGLAVAVAFKCGLLNIGAEGQLIAAAFATAWVGLVSAGLARDYRDAAGDDCGCHWLAGCGPAFLASSKPGSARTKSSPPS